jgi:hypothetical protein
MNSGNHVMRIGELGVWLFESLADVRSDFRRALFHHLSRGPPHGRQRLVPGAGKIGSLGHRVRMSTSQAKEVKLSRIDSDAALFEVESGTYSFLSR